MAKITCADCGLMLGESIDGKYYSGRCNKCHDIRKHKLGDNIPRGFWYGKYPIQEITVVNRDGTEIETYYLEEHGGSYSDCYWWAPHPKKTVILDEYENNPKDDGLEVDYPAPEEWYAHCKYKVLAHYTDGTSDLLAGVGGKAKILFGVDTSRCSALSERTPPPSPPKDSEQQWSGTTFPSATESDWMAIGNFVDRAAQSALENKLIRTGWYTKEDFR